MLHIAQKPLSQINESNVRFEVFTTVTMKSTVFWYAFTNISEESTASMFRVDCFSTPLTIQP
jgi:hypothetical protein